MSTSEVSPETPLDKGQRAEAAIPTNVRVYLGLSGKTQKALGEALGITKSAMSMKMCGKVGWSVSDLVTTADFLGHSTLGNAQSFSKSLLCFSA